MEFLWLPFVEWVPQQFLVRVPLWLPLALFALPTAYLWWADSRRVRPGRCPKCRYDRAGLAADDPCPECGTKVQAATHG